MVKRLTMVMVQLGAVASLGAGCATSSDDGDDGPTSGTDNSRSCTADTCPKKGTPVTFRLDDLQNGWCTSQQTMLIDAFVDNGYPLSVGIIGEAFDPAATSGWDKTITNYMNSSKIQKAIKSGLLQVVSHSYSLNPPGNSGDLFS